MSFRRGQLKYFVTVADEGQITRAAKKLENMSEKIEYGEMPMKKYTLIHADARLTASRRKELMDWLDAEAAHLKSSAINEK